MSTVVLLEGRGVPPDKVGGKAAALDRLIGGGFPVPPAGVITTDAYRRFVSHSRVRAFLEELWSTSLPSPDRFEESTKEVDEAFLDAPMPPDLRDEIFELAARLKDGGLLAIRSSATAEDMTTASFAGQYRSYLEVGDDDVLEKVKLTWASLWAPAPRSYRRHRGIAEDDVAMAVVVMRMVEATHAGVAFTVDPQGKPDQMRVEVVEGLGEGLVSGAETPDAYVVPRRDHRRWPSGLAGPLDRLADIALDVEERFGEPQDVEWAFDGTRVYLVQTRPITAVPREHAADDDGFDTLPMEGCTYTPAGIGEMLPGVLPPLLWTINGPLMEEAFRRLFDGLAIMPAHLVSPTGIIGRFRGRTALNLDLLKEAARNMPGGSGVELERQYFGEVISEDVEKESPRGRWAVVRTIVPAVRAMRLRRGLAGDARVVIEAIDEVIALNVDVSSLDPDHLLVYRRRVRELAARAIATETAVAAAAAAAYRALEMFLENYVEKEASSLAQKLTSGGVGQCWTNTPLDVCELVGEALDHPDLKDALVEGAEAEKLDRVLRSSEAGRDFLRRFHGTVRRAGSASVFGGPTWEEREDVAWTALRQAISVETSAGRPGMPGGRGRVLAELEDRLTKNWRWRLTRVVTGQIVDVRKRLLRRTVADAVQFIALREETKAAMLRLGGESRRIIMRIAELLVKRGMLDDAGDVDYLADYELEDALSGRPPARSAVDERRRALANAQAAGPLPRKFVGRPDPVVEEVAEGDTLTGWGAGPGRHRGRVRVIRDLASADVSKGDILVAHATDPSWTPLFLTAGAIVVEEGGPLSHAAIVARELGLPAVLNVPGALARLASVEEVTVDGDAGTIVVHGTSEEEEDKGEAA